MDTVGKSTKKDDNPFFNGLHAVILTYLISKPPYVIHTLSRYESQLLSRMHALHAVIYYAIMQYLWREISNSYHIRDTPTLDFLKQSNSELLNSELLTLDS